MSLLVVIASMINWLSMIVAKAILFITGGSNKGELVCDKCAQDDGSLFNRMIYLAHDGVHVCPRCQRRFTRKTCLPEPPPAPSHRPAPLSPWEARL